MTARPDAAFLVARPAHFVALGFGTGLASRAPGTFGTLLGFPIAWTLGLAHSDALYLAVVVALFAVGTWAAGATSRDLGVDDHGAIVIDEIAAFVLLLHFTPQTVPMQALAFVLFRVFDITKPPPIRQADRAIKGGFGVMFDDLLAAVYALLAMWLIQQGLASLPGKAFA